MSPTSSGVFRPRRTAWASMSISSSRDRHGGRVAEHRHRAGVADQDHVHAGLLGHLCARVVVGGDHHDRLAERLLLGERGEADGGTLGGTVTH